MQPLAEVDAEIAVLIRTQMEREAVQELGNQLLTALEQERSIDEKLSQNELMWISETDIERNSFVVNREIVNEVFSLPKPTQEIRRSNLTLSNGTFVLVELNQVNEGSIDSIPEEQIVGLSNSIKTDLGNNDFQAYMASLRESAEIQTNLEQAF